jgi:hypothetical protein
MKEAMRKSIGVGCFLWIGGIAASIILLAVLLYPATGFAGQPQPPGDGATDAYDFPVKPGTPEWAAFQTHDEMLAACQVPEPILREMSTAGLIETCLNYPLYGDMLCYNSPQQGFDAVASRFNGLQELLRREDVGTRLLERYRKMDPEAIGESWTSLQRGDYDRGFTYIEMLLAQDQVLSSLTQAERRDLLEVCLQKVRSKQAHAEVYGYSGQAYPVWIVGRILQMESPGFAQGVQENASLQAFLERGSLTEVEDLNAILSFAQDEFLSNR